jgi:hypothetical protein
VVLGFKSHLEDYHLQDLIRQDLLVEIRAMEVQAPLEYLEDQAKDLLPLACRSAEVLLNGALSQET